jgi:hypothetical protein
MHDTQITPVIVRNMPHFFLVRVLGGFLIGNIHLLLAAAIVLGFRWAGTWAFVLLTKVTPGVGLLWFAVRREWRPLAIALGTTALIAGVSFVVAPDAWRDWIALLRHDGGTQSSVLLVRIAVAAVIVAWGGLTDRRWTVPVAAMLALPVVWMDSFSMLLGCVAVADPRSFAPRRAAARRPASAGRLDHGLARDRLRPRPSAALAGTVDTPLARTAAAPRTSATASGRAARPSPARTEAATRNHHREHQHRPSRRVAVPTRASAATPNGTSIPKWWNQVTGSTISEAKAPHSRLSSVSSTASALTTAMASAAATTTDWIGAIALASRPSASATCTAGRGSRVERSTTVLARSTVT